MEPMDIEYTTPFVEQYSKPFKIKYVIIDTNAWYDELSKVVELLTRNICIVYVPQILIEEIDSKKNTEELGRLARDVSRIIEYHQTLRISLQVEAANLNFKGLLEAHSNDDKFLNSCLYLQAIGKEVIFVTNDRNLKIRAIAQNIASCTTDVFFAVAFTA